MNCCIKCFKSEELRSIIRSLDNLGVCNFCGAEDTNVYNLSNDTGLENVFNDVLSIFNLSQDLIKDGFPPEKLISIRDEFEKRWNIFNNFDGNLILHFLTKLLEHRYPSAIELLHNQVGIIEWMNSEYLKNKSILKGKPWSEFVYYIKHQNRFHTTHINFEILKDYLIRITNIIEDEVYYRGRILILTK